MLFASTTRPWPTRVLAFAAFVVKHFLTFYVVPIHPDRWSCLFAAFGFYLKVIWGPYECCVCHRAPAVDVGTCPREACLLAWVEERCAREGIV